MARTWLQNDLARIASLGLLTYLIWPADQYHIFKTLTGHPCIKIEWFFFYVKIWVFNFSWSIRFGKLGLSFQKSACCQNQHTCQAQAFPPSQAKHLLSPKPRSSSPQHPTGFPHIGTLTLLFIHLFIWREERQELLCHYVYRENGEGNKQDRVYDMLSLACLPFSPWPALRTFNEWPCDGSVPSSYPEMTVPDVSATFFPPWLWQFECLNYSPFMFKFASSSLKQRNCP